MKIVREKYIMTFLNANAVVVERKYQVRVEKSFPLFLEINTKKIRRLNQNKSERKNTFKHLLPFPVATANIKRQ
jgi:hypothetical protein